MPVRSFLLQILLAAACAAAGACSSSPNDEEGLGGHGASSLGGAGTAGDAGAAGTGGSGGAGTAGNAGAGGSGGAGGTSAAGASGGGASGGQAGAAGASGGGASGGQAGAAGAAGGGVKAFPRAVGFGTETVAGRGGQIVKVTNLDDSGAGSFRAAIDASGPRIIVFEVGGVISLKSDLRISDGYVTIAGQTAPFPGIMLKGFGARITTSDVLMQHIAIRVGDDGRTADGSWDNADALQIIGSGSSNIIIDHCSLSWGIDENASVWASNARDITFSNNIIGEGLMNSVHTKGAHSKGLLIGGGSNNPKDVAIIGNLFAHNLDRNPQLKGGTSTFVSNNVVYNYGGLPYTAYGSNLTRNYVSEKTLATFIGNVYVDGPDTPSSSYAIAANSTLTSDSEVFAYDNENMSRPSYLLNSWAKTFQVSSPPVSVSAYVPLASEHVVDSVLTYTGSRPAERDDVDARIVQEVLARTGSRKDHSNGLWPDYPATSRSLDPYLPANPHGDDNGDGYTNVEHVLHEMADQVEGR